jgi:hypothetical protein
VMLAQQQPDGMLPDAIFDEGIVIEIDHPIPWKGDQAPDHGLGRTQNTRKRA